MRGKLKCVSTYDKQEGRWVYRGGTKRYVKAPNEAMQSDSSRNLDTQTPPEGNPSWGGEHEAEVACLPMAIGEYDEFEAEMEAARFLGNEDPEPPREREMDGDRKREAFGGLGEGIVTRPQENEAGKQKGTYLAAAKARSEAKKMEEQAIHGVGRRLEAVPTSAKQRMEELGERIWVASRGIGHPPPPSLQQGTSGNGERFEVKVAPSDGHCLFHAMV